MAACRRIISSFAWKPPEHMNETLQCLPRQTESHRGQREGGGRTPEYWVCRTGGDVKLEVRNNWCNAGEWRRGLAAGGVEGIESQALQCFAVGEHQSRAHLATIRLQRDPVFREQVGHEPALQHYTPLTALCNIIYSYYLPHVCIAGNAIILYLVP